jgi:hypothetical protein
MIALLREKLDNDRFSIAASVKPRPDYDYVLN